MTRFLAIIAAAAALAVVLPGSAPPAIQPTAPTGLTGLALSGSVALAWQPVTGATAYAVYRGTSATAVTTAVTPTGGVAAAGYTDASATNGTSYFYVVRAISGGAESPDSNLVQSTPVPRACSSGNAIVLENCFPGNTPWNVRNTATIAAGGIEGYATATSIQAGESVNLKVNSGDSSTFRVEIYRTGYYGGAGARLFSVVRSVQGVAQPACTTDTATGLVDCANWSKSLTLTTTSAWPTGVYAIRLVREDTGTDSQILLAVRDDSGHSALVYGVGFSNFEAYNNYGGKSLYDFNSQGSVTVSGTARAVKVSYDRPFEQPRSGLRDWYTRTEFASVYWLEQEGYDVSYVSNSDLDARPASLLDHKAYFSPAHDEYVSQGMRDAMRGARDAGRGLFISGGNAVYWRIRFEDGAGGPNRIQVSYKSTQSGGPDPSGVATGTWRDPAGANQPENALTGIMYVGDNDNTYFPLVVDAVQGADRVYRYTGLDAQPAGGSTRIGSNLVGWEWDSRVANGAEAAGVKTLASSPVSGELVQENGKSYTPGSTSVTMVKYVAPGGGLVFSTGTNHWNRGLAPNASGVGETDLRIQQVTTNVLEDMGVVPTTATSGIVLDNASVALSAAPTGVTASAVGPDSVTVSWDPVPGATSYNVYRSLASRTDGLPLGALASGGPITATSFTDFGLSSTTAYFYVVVAVTAGVQSAASNEAGATTGAGAGQPTRIDSGASPTYTSAAGQVFTGDTFVAGGAVRSSPAPISGTNDAKLYQTERWGAFSYAIPVATGTYDVRFHFAETYWGVSTAGSCVGKRVFGLDIVDTATSPDLANIDICAAVGPGAAYVRNVSNVNVVDGFLNIRTVYGLDDPTLEAIEVIPTAIAPPTVVSTVPAALETDVGAGSWPRATFSRAMDATTLDAAHVSLVAADGTTVPATTEFDAPSRTVTIKPSASLSFRTTYTATLRATIKAADGAPLGTAYTWTFTTQAPPAPDVLGTSPDDGATGISQNAQVRTTFTRPLDAATVTGASYTLRDANGALVPARVSYDDTSHTASLSANAPLAVSATYTARLSTAVKSADGVALSAPYVWSFTTASTPPAAPTAVATLPATGETNVKTTVAPAMTFSRSMDGNSITSSTFTIAGPAGTVPASVSYDAATSTATLVPAVPLAGLTTYTVTADTNVRASDGTPLAAAASWSFTTVPPPSVVSVTPAAGSAYNARASVVTATFSRSMDPASLTNATFTLRVPGGGAVAATVTYNTTTLAASLTPTTPLADGTTYAATVSAGVRATDGAALGAASSWTFTTAACPCSLFAAPLTPASQDLPTRDGRAGFGPWTYELGVKFTVDQPMRLNGMRFLKSRSESGVHTGSLWTASGALLASTTFAGESASGWQQQGLASPPLLVPGAVYVVSVNANSYYNVTSQGLAAQVIAGPLRSVADGANGVFAPAAGQFPSQSFHSSNYFVDVDVSPDGDPPSPTIVSTTPASDAQGVNANLPLKVVFSRRMNPATINRATFELKDAGGSVVDATVAYDDATNTGTLTPSAPLAHGTSYTAALSTDIRARDGKPLAAPFTWSFAIGSPSALLSVTATSPGNGPTNVSFDTSVTLTFNRSLDPTTVTAANLQLLAPSGATVATTISYDNASTTVTLKPTSNLAQNTAYTVRASTGIRAADGTSLLNPYTLSFTTGTCPCSPLLGLTPAKINNPTQDGRTGAGPWSYELGLKFAVDQAATLSAVRFWKDTRETGSHTARVWTASGTLLTTAAVTGETASGWQTVILPTAINLAPGTTYVVSVNANAFFSVTRSGLATQLTSGIAHTVADGKNGVYGSAAGTFPTLSFSSTNYFVDVVVR